MKGIIYQGLVFVLTLASLTETSFAEQPLPQIPARPGQIDEVVEAEVKQPAGSEIRALIKPLHEAVLSNELAAKVTKINVSEGGRFKKGELLVKFDCKRYKAELAAARAEYRARDKVHKNNQELAQLNAVGKLELDVSKAQSRKALAEFNVVNARKQSCTIMAPWNGRVVEIKANEHEVIAPGQEIMSILDDSSLKIEMIVPSRWLSWLKAGAAQTMKIDETQKEYAINIVRLGARVDPVSQTIRVIAGFSEKVQDILAGMSGTVTFNVPD